MKLIFSRKGFDSSAGGIPSPILPDGRMISLPIPANPYDKKTLHDVYLDGIDLHQMVDDLSGGKAPKHIHLDPELSRHPRQTPSNWRPAFGQVNAAQTHLSNHQVGIGDVFLFFGWFKEVEQSATGRWQYKKAAPDIQVMFGWLEIGEIFNTIKDREQALSTYPWLIDHPHFNQADYTHPSNTVYLAKNKSVYSDTTPFGGGVFPSFSTALQLTKNGMGRSVWQLPKWFYPVDDHALSYHSNLDCWEYLDDSESIVLHSAKRGQEFVIDSTYYPQLENWLTNIIKNHV